MSDIPPLTGEKRIPAFAISITDGIVISSIVGVFSSPFSSFVSSAPSPRKFSSISSIGPFKSLIIGSLDMIFHGIFTMTLTGFPNITFLMIHTIPAIVFDNIVPTEFIHR
ncbi:hypothetical protein HanRHA438_Chr09g0426401 [Helianthus annuus]|nr:hypothetical protein HanIR_Chr09g0446231 [Helianthus annuus]KAJ0890669.1 hypothetical protein HanRHA438_Chr09g0426401 [Helianthus annuus]